MDIEELINQGKEGNEKAFYCLYQAFAPQMIVKCINIVGNRMIAEELTHDAFLLAFAKLNQLQNPTRFVNWLSSIVTNVALRYVKQNKILPTISLLEMPEKELSKCYDVDNIETDEIIIPPLSEILTAIDSLPQGYAKVFKMSVIQGLSHNEISEILGIAARTSSSQLTRAKRLLRQNLSKKWTLLLVAILVPTLYFILKNKKSEKSEHHISSNNEVRGQYRRASIVEKNIDTTPTQLPPTNSIHKTLATKSKVHQVAPTPDTITITEIDSTILIIKENYPIDTLNTNNDTINIIQNITSPTPNKIICKNENFDTSNLPKFKKSSWNLHFAFANNYGANSINRESLIEDYVNIDGILNMNNWATIAQQASNASNISTEQKEAIIKIANENIKNGNRSVTESTKHHLPFTLSITFSWSMNHNINIESGLNYSFLSSEFIKGRADLGFVDNQKIHYIGIPLKLSYKWHETNRWSIYSSAGFVMDIPVKSYVDTDYMFKGKSLYYESEPFNAPIQWSTGLGVGLQYNFTPQFGIYAEPNIYYFIPTDSEIETYRTEHPISISIPIGFRLNW